jgi:predicted component of type VI protein secretion system
MASLRLVPVSGQPVEGVKDQSAVGRDPSCEIVVTDGSVSRRHARLERRGEAWWVVDLGSANGTYVNSLKVGEQALKNGQELRFGALAFRVDIVEDPEATVSAAVLQDSATVMAPTFPPPVPPAAPPATPRPAPGAPTPLGHAAVPPPPPLSPAAPRDRHRPTGPTGPPVAQMPAGGAPPKKGKGPVFWIAVGCCGCLLAVAALAAVIGGGAFMATKGAADAAQAWLGDVREGRMESAAAGLSSDYRSRLSQEELEAHAVRIQASRDATFPGRSIDNDRAILTGVLTGSGTPKAIVIRLVREQGAWKVDDVHFGLD